MIADIETGETKVVCAVAGSHLRWIRSTPKPG